MANEKSAVKFNPNLVRLLITCPDRPGIIAATANFLKSHGGNICDLDQHSTDPEDGTFFMRLEFQMPGALQSRQSFDAGFKTEVATPFQMQYTLAYAAEKKKMGILVSKYDHAILEILWRWASQELSMEIPWVISNHPDLEPTVRQFGIPFYCIPVTSDTKVSAEKAMLAHCQGQVDGIILARYMQILSEDFVKVFKNKIINIHHSFLPAFMGANPYQQAYNSGVKLIGATAHYVTQELDMGPIIAQDVINVSHRLNVSELRQCGQHIERQVLARAVQAHIEDRIIVAGNKTIVFANH